MTLPHLNGKTGMALSMGTLVSVLGMGAAVIQDRMRIAEQIVEIQGRVRVYDDIVAGRTYGMSGEARERIEALERRLHSLERAFTELEGRADQLERKLP